MKLTTEWLSSMSDQLYMHLTLKVHKDQDSPTKSLGWGTQKKCHGCNFCFRGIKGDTKPAGNWRGSIGVYIMHCLQCHWANLIAAFYASVNESEKEESGGEKKKVCLHCSHCSLCVLTFQFCCSGSCRMILLLKTGFVLGFFPYLETTFQWRRTQLFLLLRISRLELIEDAGKTTETYLMECIWVSMSCAEMRNQEKNVGAKL